MNQRGGLAVEVSLLSPLLVGNGEAGGCLDYLPGRVMRAAVIDSIIKRIPHGRSICAVSCFFCDNFAKEDAAIFRDFYPSRSGTKHRPLPLTAMSCELDPTHGIFDSLLTELALILTGRRSHLTCAVEGCGREARTAAGYGAVSSGKIVAAPAVQRIARLSATIDRFTRTAKGHVRVSVAVANFRPADRRWSSSLTTGSRPKQYNLEPPLEASPHQPVDLPAVDTTLNILQLGETSLSSSREDSGMPAATGDDGPAALIANTECGAPNDAGSAAVIEIEAGTERAITESGPAASIYNDPTASMPTESGTAGEARKRRRRERARRSLAEGPRDERAVAQMEPVLLAGRIDCAAGAQETFKQLIDQVCFVGGGTSYGLGEVKIAASVEAHERQSVDERVRTFNTALAQALESCCGSMDSSARPAWRGGSVDELSERLGRGTEGFFVVDLVSDALLCGHHIWSSGGRSADSLSSPHILDGPTLQALAGIDTEVELVLCRAGLENKTGWDVDRGLAKPPIPVSSRGGVFVFWTPNLSPWIRALDRLEERGLGEGVVDGFGHLEVCSAFHLCTW